MREALGKLDRGWSGVSPQRKERQRAGLPGGHLGEFGTTVADLHSEQTGQRVEVALAAVVEDGDTLAASDDRRRDVGTMPGEVQPEVVSHVVRERSLAI